MPDIDERVATLETLIQQLQEQQARTYEAIRLVLEGRWNGDMPHAEAFVKAIRPDEAGTWSAESFPKE